MELKEVTRMLQAVARYESNRNLGNETERDDVVLALVSAFETVGFLFDDDKAEQAVDIINAANDLDDAKTSIRDGLIADRVSQATMTAYRAAAELILTWAREATKAQ